MEVRLQSSVQPPPKKSKIPGPYALPIVGYLPFLGQFPERVMTKLAKKYGDVYQMRLGNQNVVVLNRLEAILQANLPQGNDFASRPEADILQRAAGGKTVGAKKYGKLWKRHREITQIALNLYAGTKSVEAEVLETATELVDTFLSQDGQPFNPEFETVMAIGGIAYWILFGDRKGCREDADFLKLISLARGFTTNSTLTLVGDFFPPVRKIFKERFGKVQDALDALSRCTSNNVEKHRKTYDPDNLRDMTDALLKASNELDESDRALGLSEEHVVQATIEETIGSGFDTLSTAIMWAWLYMIVYPEFQAGVQEEIDRVIGREKQITWQDRKKLPFTEACIHEILRLSSYFALGLPHATSTDTTLNGYFIPKDTLVMVNLYSLTRDERYWEEPEKFNPHRFLNEQGELIHDLVDKFYPFGVGKRRCLGEHLSRLEIFLFFTNVLQKCKLEKVPGDQLSLQGLPGLVIHPQSYRVTVTPRF